IAIAGILHLTLAPGMLNFNPNATILFAIGGAAQVFWAIPMVRKWGRAWYSIGIAGTVAFMLIWVVTRFPANPITGRGGNVNEMSIAVESMEALFIGLAAAVLVLESRMKKIDSKVAQDSR
ncbi:MAG TPA: hypothetical protein VJ742_03290, partial [Nitrososphaera sp.]|nr:hypothetical protein [Nitrososphaera sp.]